MTLNILNGDALAYSFPEAGIEGETAVMRECLMEGDLTGTDLPAFWQTRAKQLSVSDNDYQATVVREINRIIHAPNQTHFNLWFEYDLFCQVNMWFLLSLIHGLPINKTVSAVYTIHLDRNSKFFWNGFGPATAEQLQKCYEKRIVLREQDIYFGHQLWLAYKSNDLQQLSQLAERSHPAFPFLREVVVAHIERFPRNGKLGRPEAVVKEILESGITDFSDVFKEFWKRESVYGFGDLQLKKIYDFVVGQTGKTS